MSITDWCDIINKKDEEMDKQKLEQYDSLITSIRNILTAAGIPDHEDYPDEDVDEREKSLRTGGRMIPLDKRVQMLADMNSLAKIISRKDPKIIKQFLEDLAWELEEVYPNYETGYAPIFLGKAAWELGTMKDEVIDE